MMFKIKLRKKKNSQPEVSPASVPLLSANCVANSLLSSAAIFLRWQGLLGQYPLTPDQRRAYAPLLEIELNPTLTNLIEHVETHGVITFQEAVKLRGGGVIVDWNKIQVEPSTIQPGGE